MSATEETPRRLTPTERLHEVTMAAMTRAASPPESSVTVSRNARGVFQFEVTVRGYDVDECWGYCWPLIKTMTECYPYPSEAELRYGGGAREASEGEG